MRTAGVDRRHQSSARLRLLLLCTDALPTKWILGLFRMQLMGRHMSLNNLLDLRGAILEYSIRPPTSGCGIRAAHRFTLSQRSLWILVVLLTAGRWPRRSSMADKQNLWKAQAGDLSKAAQKFAFKRQLSTGVTWHLVLPTQMARRLFHARRFRKNGPQREACGP